MKTIFGFALMLLMYSMLGACGGSSTSSSSTSSSSTSSSSTSSSGGVAQESFVGPGSKWDLSFSGGMTGTYSVDHRPDIDSAIDFTSQGDYVLNNSGFLSVTATGGTGAAAPSVGEKTWALYVPGYAVVVKPFASYTKKDQLIPLVVAGKCPTQNVNANWVVVKPNTLGTANSSSAYYVGGFTYDINSKIASLNNVKALTTNFPDVSLSLPSNQTTCSNGIMRLSVATMYLTESAGALVHVDYGTASEADDAFMYGMSKSNIASMSETDGQYIGMLYDGSASAGSKILPIAANCTSGSCSTQLVTDTATGSTTTAPYTVTFTDVNRIGATIIDGFITGTITNGASTGNMLCMADKTGTKKMVSCVSQTPGSLTNMFNVLLVSK